MDDMVFYLLVVAGVTSGALATMVSLVTNLFLFHVAPAAYTHVLAFVAP